MNTTALQPATTTRGPMTRARLWSVARGAWGGSGRLRAAAKLAGLVTTVGLGAAIVAVGALGVVALMMRSAAG